jgi:hypothetical protein
VGRRSAKDRTAVEGQKVSGAMIVHVDNSNERREAMAPIERIVLDFFKRQTRTDWTYPAIVKAISSEVRVSKNSVIRYISRLVQKEKLKSQRHGQYNSYLVVGRRARSEKPGARPKKFLPLYRFLRQQCAHSGKAALNFNTIAEAIKRKPSTCSYQIANLEKMGHITVTPSLGSSANIYAVTGLTAAFPKEPPAHTVEAAVLNYLRAQCAGTGTGECRLSLGAIATGVHARDKMTVQKAIAKLKKMGLIGMTRVIRSSSAVFQAYIYTAPPADPAQAPPPAKSRRGRKTGPVTEKIAALLSKLGYPERVSYHQVKGCFPPNRVLRAKSDPGERRKITKQANMVIRRLNEKNKTAHH